MKQWRGLLMKEWINMKNLLYSLLVLDALVLFIVPSGFKRLFGIEEDLGTIRFMVGGILLFFHSLVALIFLIISLEKDIIRQDIWLHTTATMQKLVGTKIIFTIFVTSVSLLFIGVVTFGQFFISISNQSSELIDMGKFLILVNVMTFITSIYLCVVGFFFWVIYQTLRMRIQYYAIPVTLVLFVLINYWWNKILSSAFFTKTFAIGTLPVNDFIPQSLLHETINVKLDFSTEPFLIGILLFITFTTVLLYVSATSWLDKKVRV
ncbi:MAG TPA: hypothetical protein VLQ66_13510 [Paenisporosarcina sp.]|nr:hypothetical protein [Paenisporosarcina sp.]